MPEYIADFLSHKLFISLVVIVALLGLRGLLVRLIRRKADILSEEQRRWTSRAKNVVVAAILVILIFLWWPELHRFALSIAAVAVAFVIASKELILCISGAMLRATSGSSSVGDWVEIGEIRGEVVDQNILSIVLQEIDKESCAFNYTGKTITLPNSVFLSQPVKNMNFMRRFVFLSFSIHTEPDVNAFEAKQLVLDKLNMYCEEFSELGKRYHSFVVKHTGLDIPSPEPSVKISTTTLGKNTFSVTLFCPTPQATELQQRITEDFFNFYYEKRNMAKTESEGESEE